MLSVNYSLGCTTFDPKGKLLQVSIDYFLIIVTDRIRKRSREARSNLHRS
jgi:hypothetical protein